MARRQKDPAKEIRGPILVIYVIGGETRLYDFGGIVVYYISYIPFEQISAADTTECRIGMIFATLRIVKSYFYITFLQRLYYTHYN